MKDIERQILQAFLFALIRQDQPLPAAIQQQLNIFSASLDNHIADLDQIATDTPSLAVPYLEAHKALTEIASLRAKGVLPAIADSGDTDQEIDNLLRDIQPELALTQEILERIHQNLTQVPFILSAQNSVQQAQHTFKP